MPNHVINKLTISGTKENVEKLLEAIRNTEESMLIDFNKIFPMPEELKGTTSPPRKRDKTLIEKYGTDNWYDWSCTNWGTKWNAYEQTKGEPQTDETGNQTETIFFQTAWSTPFPVIRKLSEQFPEVNLHVTFADEDAGHNCGMYSLFDGEEVDETYLPEGGSSEAMKVYFELWGGEEDWEIDDNDEYQYKEE